MKISYLVFLVVVFVVISGCTKQQYEKVDLSTLNCTELAELQRECMDTRLRFEYWDCNNAISPWIIAKCGEEEDLE